MSIGVTATPTLARSRPTSRPRKRSGKRIMRRRTPMRSPDIMPTTPRLAHPEPRSRRTAAPATNSPHPAALAPRGAAPAADGGARHKELEGMTSDPNLKISFASDVVEVAHSGDLAYSRGHYSLQSTDATTKQPTNSSGTY